MPLQALCIISSPSRNQSLSQSLGTINSGPNQVFGPYDLEIWQMTLKKCRTSVLCQLNLCASFRCHLWIQTRVTVLKHSKLGKMCFDLCDLDLWCLILTFCMDITFLYENSCWKFLNDTMRIEEHSQKGVIQEKMDRQMDRTIHRAAWLQLRKEV